MKKQLMGRTANITDTLGAALTVEEAAGNAVEAFQISGAAEVVETL